MKLPTPEIERLTYHMKTVARDAENIFASGFARSILRQSKKPGWTPSPKQMSVMQALVADLFAYGDVEEREDLIVIE